MIAIKRLENSDIRRIGEIDRSEHVTLSYVYKDGRLETEEVDWHVPRWFTDGSGKWSVEAHKKGFELAKKVNKELYALEPEDIHMIKTL